MTRGMANFIDFYIYHFELLKWRNIENVSEGGTDREREDEKLEGEGIVDRERNVKLRVEERESFDFMLYLARRVYLPDE